jgi:GNAT superfamily N-acetyltransferase
MQITTIPTEAYLAYLNEVFPHWGDAAVYNWVFTNNTGNETSDIFALADTGAAAGNILAGSGITYRSIGYGAGAGAGAGFCVKAGIMTGSWTLPAHRGKGCFTKMIEESFRRVKEKNYDALAAFVTQKNASAGRLKAAGSAMLPAYYVFSDTDAGIGGFSGGASDGVSGGVWKPEIVFPDAAVCVRLHEAHIGAGAGAAGAGDVVRFLYTPEEFRKQFIERPAKPFVLSANGLLLVAEETNDAVKILLADKRDLVLWVETLKKLATWAHKQKGKKVYYYTTLETEKKLLAEAGFLVVPGFFTLLLFNDEARAAPFPALDIQLGDKM